MPKVWPEGAQIQKNPGFAAIDWAKVAIPPALIKEMIVGHAPGNNEPAAPQGGQAPVFQEEILVGPTKFGLPANTPDHAGFPGLMCKVCGRDWTRHNNWDCVPPPNFDGEPPEPEDPDGLVIHQPKPGKPPGPAWVESKMDKAAGVRVCSTCTRLRAIAEVYRSADDLYLCARCWEMHRKCQYCGWMPAESDFVAKVYVWAYCPECAPSKKKLHVKQFQEFTPKSDVLGVRRERVWRTTSSR